ncbi:hypothetical protein [Mameliella alba]|uniref:hypothetical protein n=1 Tax=Mameliella alba TaxID=561184 RepID=UPI00088FBAF1|nr:hypothetical protein [Mameliella alba]OWV39389.1 hypothetical protein CDZ95_26030 [Mameliella alba]OWV46499.1 hypothetical protein CDZ96_17975 [Mameliella alba]PTR37313.1 hypothetical protein LX94_03652 [Mameliella alba]SDD75974.1 hypothetical protein SAMN05216376_111111 [Mameliella alba]GGF73735.1 hypothetical protein GCM10011319_37840 [Mameliella alba]
MIAAMIYLWFKCAACGFENSVPAPRESHGLLRDQILRRCKCRRCRHVGASDMLRYYDPGADPLWGARTD